MVLELSQAPVLVMMLIGMALPLGTLLPRTRPLLCHSLRLVRSGVWHFWRLNPHCHCALGAKLVHRPHR